MEKLISGRCHLQPVPETYILPPESRPGQTQVPLCETIPVIDLEGELSFDRAHLIKQIIQASQEFGFFQLINHGVSEKLTHELMWARSSLCCLPRTRQAYILRTPSKIVDTSIDYDSEKVHYWRDTLRHPCHPLEEHVQFWPEKPPHYREEVGNHTAEVRKLSSWVLVLICEGLGLESRYLREELGHVQLMAINHYPPCPDPSLTLGLPKHSDVNLITFLLQGESHGIQVLKDGQWLAIEPLPKSISIEKFQCYFILQF